MTVQTAGGGSRVYMAPEQFNADQEKAKPATKQSKKRKTRGGRSAPHEGESDDDDESGELECRTFFKADVWAFGCLLYELTQKEIPWTHTGKEDKALDGHAEDMIPTHGNARLLARLSPREDVNVEVRSSARLESKGLKEFCPTLYNLLQQCWEMDPDDRPDFGEILRKVSEVELEIKMNERLKKAEGALRERLHEDNAATQKRLEAENADLKEKLAKFEKKTKKAQRALAAALNDSSESDD